MVKIGQDYITSASVKSLQSCPTLQDPMDGSPPGSSVQGILQARTLEWVAVPSPRGSSWSRDWTLGFSCLLHWRVGSLPPVPPGKPKKLQGSKRKSVVAKGGMGEEWDKWAMWLPPRLRHQDHTAITLWAHSPLCSSTCSSPLAQAGARKPLSRPTPEGESSDQVSPAPWSQVLWFTHLGSAAPERWSWEGSRGPRTEHHPLLYGVLQLRSGHKAQQEG